MPADVATPVAVAKVDQRRDRRYLMGAAVAFCWDAGDGILREGQGTTLDVSSRGAFVVTGLAPQVGDRLELEIYLRPNGCESKIVCFHGEGKVVRTLKKGSESGFAAEVLFQTQDPDNPLSEYGGAIQ